MTKIEFNKLEGMYKKLISLFEKLGIGSDEPFRFDSYCEGLIHYVQVTSNIEKIHITFLAPIDEPFNFLNIDSFGLHLINFDIFEVWKICDGQAYVDREILFEHENILE
jgi:hypothetical protein